MTPLQVAKTHCANYQDDGSCLGLELNDDLTTKRLIKHHKCVLAIPARCGYFEECVVPMNRADWPELVTPNQHQEFADAIKKYQLTCNVSSSKKRVCPQCKVRELEPSKRLCYVCRNNQRKATYRKANFKGVTSTTEVGNSPIDMQRLKSGANGEPYKGAE